MARQFRLILTNERLLGTKPPSLLAWTATSFIRRFCLHGRRAVRMMISVTETAALCHLVEPSPRSRREGVLRESGLLHGNLLLIKVVVLLRFDSVCRASESPLESVIAELLVQNLDAPLIPLALDRHNLEGFPGEPKLLFQAHLAWVTR